MHHIRVALDQLVRADKEEQVPRVLIAARPQVFAQSPAMPARAQQEQNHPLRHEAGERAAQATGTLRHQGTTIISTFTIVLTPLTYTGIMFRRTKTIENTDCLTTLAGRQTKLQSKLVDNVRRNEPKIE